MNSDQWVQVTKPILRRHNDENNLIEMCYRNDNHVLNMIHDKDLINLWDKIKEFVENEDNQFEYQLNKNEIVVIDNHSVMHGRTVFNEGELRIIKRMNFENDQQGILHQVLKHGIEEIVFIVIIYIHLILDIKTQQITELYHKYHKHKEID